MVIDRTAIENARDDPAFEHRGWLTFYLATNPEKHALMAPGLDALNAVNLDGAEGGFVYAKVPVAVTEPEIEERISQVRQLASEADVDVVIIDLDASADVNRSKFFTLWRELPA